MILAVDMGNTHIVLGVLEGDKILCSERIATDHRKTSAEYEVLIHSILSMRNIKDSDIEGAIVSSVVPPLTHDVCEAIKKAVGKRTLPRFGCRHCGIIPYLMHRDAICFAKRQSGIYDSLIVLFVEQNAHIQFLRDVYILLR